LRVSLAVPVIASILIIAAISGGTQQAFAGSSDDPFIIFDGNLLEDPFGDTGDVTFSGQFDFAPDPAYVPLAPILQPINATIFISRDSGSFRVFEDAINDGLTVDIDGNSAGEIFFHIPGVGPDGRDEISVDLTSDGMTDAIQVNTNVGQVSGVIPFIDIADGSGGFDFGVPAAFIEEGRIVFPLEDFPGTDVTDVDVVDLHFIISELDAARSFTVTDIFGTTLAPPPPPGKPTIQITVVTIDGDGSFDFRIENATNPADFIAVNIPDTSIDNQSPPLPIQAASYSVFETVPLNWNLISSDCLINGVPHGNTEFFNIINGDTVECTFVNLFVPPAEPTCTLPDVDNAPSGQCADVPVSEVCEFVCNDGFKPDPPNLTCQDNTQFDAIPECEARPSIQITVDTTGGDGSFDFRIENATNPADFFAVNIPDTFINNMSAPLFVQAASYSVIETVPLNWNLISSDCLINGASQGSTLNFNIINGDTVECVFENIFVPPPVPPTIKITKDTTNGDGSFNFTIFNATNPADFIAVNIPDTSINDMTTPLTVQAGPYSVIETVPLNWNLISSDCLINGILQGSTLNFNIIDGDTVECIFENTFVPPPFCVGNPCNDGISCTVDTCDEDTDTCNNIPDNTLCDDGTFCNGSETCDAQIGCQDGTPPVIDDGVGCTDDSCNEDTQMVVNNPDDSQCIATSCTVGMCVEGVGCESSNVADGTVCEDIGVCMVGVCTFNEPPVADANGPYLTSIDTATLLDSTGTFDPDGDDLIYQWSTTSDCTFDDATLVGPQITCPETGIFDVSLTVTDPFGESDTDITSIVIYDPAGGFVTGGGWIDSPAGAYTDDLTLDGKATFGFVSKYKKGQTQPIGQTEFQFKVADLNFHSSSYEWLVIAGHQAKYKGMGTINGEGNYGFMLSAVDAKLTPSIDVDKFRINIWDKDNGDVVVYDNQPGDTDDAELTTAIGGGAIVIHSGKGKP